MEERHKEFLQSNFALLVDQMAMEDSFLYGLYEKGLLSKGQWEKICCQQTRTEKANYIMQLLPKRGPFAYQIFINLLEEYDLDTYCLLFGLEYPEKERENDKNFILNGQTVQAIVIVSSQNWDLGIDVASKLEEITGKQICLLSTEDLDNKDIFVYSQDFLKANKLIYGIITCDLEKDYFSQVMLASLGNNVILLCNEHLTSLPIFGDRRYLFWPQHQAKMVTAILEQVCTCSCHH